MLSRLMTGSVLVPALAPATGREEAGSRPAYRIESEDDRDVPLTCDGWPTAVDSRGTQSPAA